MSMFSFVKRVLTGTRPQPEVVNVVSQLQRPTKEVKVRKRNAKGQFIA